MRLLPCRLHVANHRRLAAVTQLVRGYATGRQKSVHECTLTNGKRNDLMPKMSLLLEKDTDLLLFLRLVPRALIHVLDRATAPADPDYFFIG